MAGWRWSRSRFSSWLSLVAVEMSNAAAAPMASSSATPPATTARVSDGRRTHRRGAPAADCAVVCKAGPYRAVW
jgi:hypothetical protein